jgi:hypothetical protein
VVSEGVGGNLDYASCKRLCTQFNAAGNAFVFINSEPALLSVSR